MGALLAVFLGGIVGTGIRLELDVLVHHSDSQFPLDTLLINIVGSFLLAVLITRVWPIAPAWLKAGLGPGLLGGFTTFSAVMVSMVTLAASSQILVALIYALLSLVFGFGAAALGFRVARRREIVPTIEVDE
jgi:CrcB protein